MTPQQQYHRTARHLRRGSQLWFQGQVVKYIGGGAVYRTRFYRSPECARLAAWRLVDFTKDTDNAVEVRARVV